MYQSDMRNTSILDLDEEAIRAIERRQKKRASIADFVRFKRSYGMSNEAIRLCMRLDSVVAKPTVKNLLKEYSEYAGYLSELVIDSDLADMKQESYERHMLLLTRMIANVA